MKKMYNLFALVFLLVASLGFVAAANETGDVVAAPARVGWFEDLGDRLDLVFTFDKEKKIEKILEMAEKRLAEAELLAEENPAAYEEAQKRYDDLVTRAEEILANMKEREEDVNDSLDDVGKAIRIQDKFERHQAQADEIYTRVLEKFELNNASDEKIERFEKFYERALNRSDRMRARIIEKRANALSKYKNFTEMSDDEIEEVITEVEENEGINGSREERRARAEARLERVVEVRGHYIERVRLRLDDLNLTDRQRLKIEKRLKAANENIGLFELRYREMNKHGDDGEDEDGEDSDSDSGDGEDEEDEDGEDEEDEDGEDEEDEDGGSDKGNSSQ